MRVVLDTGILVAALITRGTPPDQLYQAWQQKRFSLITTEWQLSEFRRVSRYPKLKRFLKPHEVGAMVHGLRRRAVVLSEVRPVDASPDPDDNLILGAAVAGSADYLVTGDKGDLLSIGRFRGVRIVEARTLADILR